MSFGSSASFTARMLSNRGCGPSRDPGVALPLDNADCHADVAWQRCAATPKRLASRRIHQAAPEPLRPHRSQQMPYSDAPNRRATPNACCPNSCNALASRIYVTRWTSAGGSVIENQPREAGCRSCGEVRKSDTAARTRASSRPSTSLKPQIPTPHGSGPVLHRFRLRADTMTTAAESEPSSCPMQSSVPPAKPVPGKWVIKRRTQHSIAKCDRLFQRMANSAHERPRLPRCGKQLEAGAGDNPQCSLASDKQLHHVVAGNVLHHAPAAFGFARVAGNESHADAVIAQATVAVAMRAIRVPSPAVHRRCIVRAKADRLQRTDCRAATLEDNCATVQPAPIPMVRSPGS